MKKYDKDTALAKIKIKIKKYYEDVGREMFEDIDTARQELIEDVDGILNNAEISQKHLILEEFEIEREGENEKS